MSFVPWRDDALCAGESPYALFNKVGWFLCRRPSDLVGSAGGGRPKGGIHYDQPEAWVDRLKQVPPLPQVHGRPLGAMLVHLAEQMRRDVPSPWRRRGITVCPRCIADGVHLRLHQHAALACCPLHPAQRMHSECPQCGYQLSFRIYRDGAPFSCWHQHGLLAKEPRALIPSAAARARRLQQVERAQAWLDELHACLPLDDAELQPETGPRVPFRVSLALEAALRTRASVPKWVVRMDVAARLALRTRPPHGPAARTSEQRVRAQERHWEVGDCAGRLRRALRVTAKEFLVQYGSRHGRCWDAPYHLLGTWPRVTASDVRLLAECPVSIGFWLWRLRWGAAHAALLGAPGFLRHTSLDREYRSRLAVIARSHLHLCVVMARQAVRVYNAGHCADAAMQTLRGLMDDGWAPSQTIPDGMVGRRAQGARPMHWHLDVVEDGVVLETDYAPDREAADSRGKAKEPALERTLPFIPMRHDWLFLHPTPILPPSHRPQWLADMIDEPCDRERGCWTSAPLPRD